MIVASIKNGFQQHSLRGLGCGNCNCKTGPPIGPAISHVHGIGMGVITSCIGVTNDREDCPYQYFNPLDAMNPNEGTPSIEAAIQAAAIAANPVVVVSSGGTGVPGGNNTIIPSIGPVLQTTYSQGVQQNGQATGVVSTPSSSVAVDNPWMDFIDSTFLGIPLWLIGVGGAIAIYIGSEK